MGEEYSVDINAGDATLTDIDAEEITIQIINVDEPGSA